MYPMVTTVIAVQTVSYERIENTNYVATVYIGTTSKQGVIGLHPRTCSFDLGSLSAFFTVLREFEYKMLSAYFSTCI